LARRFDTLRFRKPVTQEVFPNDSPAGRFAKDLNHGADMGNGFGRGAQEGEQTFPWVLTNEPHASVFFNGLMNDRVLVNFFFDRIDIILQPKKLDQKRFFNTLVEKELPSLRERKDSVRGLNEIGIENLCKAKKLSAFQGMFQRKIGDSELGGHYFLPR
jgi:hypothetical protein